MLFIPIQHLSAVKMWRLAAAIAISVLGWTSYQIKPNAPALFASYFVIWWAGVELCREYKTFGRLSFYGQKFNLGALGLMAMIQLAVVYLAFRNGQQLSLGIDPVLQLRHYVSALVFCIVAIVWQSKKVRVPQMFLAFAYLAPISFGLYVVHMPILTVMSKFISSNSLAFAAAFPVVIFTAWVLEVKMQQAVNARWKI